ncbi:MAG: hypothetical protein KBD06_03995 [Candidatus Pacebacteria bacterium]|nr:hypothetical protein [Candidatus Paceibacterota bacterium]
MKDVYLGNAGFSVLEIVVAMSFITIIISAAALSDFGARYWVIAAHANMGALDLVNEEFEMLRADTESNFYGIETHDAQMSVGDDCSFGGLCYWSGHTVDDISECLKRVEVRVSWQVQGFSTSTTQLVSAIPSPREVIARGGDCELSAPLGDWDDIRIERVAPVALSAQFTEIDALDDNIYASSNRPPYLWTFYTKGPSGSDLRRINFDNGFTLPSPSNSIDVVRNNFTGRTYAFMSQTTTTPQFLIVDVTDIMQPTIVTVVQLQGSHRPTGSFPQIWMMRVFKDRLYVFTRETAGYEFHILNISSLETPVEVGSGFELNRTVNEVIVREQKVGNAVRRYVYLAAKSGLKEVAVLDVTNDIIREVGVVNLPGSQDMRSGYISGNTLYVGRDSSASGPELYAFNIADPLDLASSSPITAEIGSGVISIKRTGNLLFLGTNTRIERWQTEPFYRVSTVAITGLIPRSLELRAGRVFAAAAGGLYELHDD